MPKVAPALLIHGLPARLDRQAIAGVRGIRAAHGLWGTDDAQAGDEASDSEEGNGGAARRRREAGGRPGKAVFLH